MTRLTTALFASLIAFPAIALQPENKPAEKPADKPAQSQPAAQAPKADEGTDPAVARETKHYNVKAGTPAIGGHDPVAYFPEGGGKAKKGDKAHAFTYRGVLYHFASAANLEAFKKNPRKYEPAYGGWCAYAMGSSGEKVEIDPESFQINGDRLFLFYTDFFTDTRKKWVKDETALKPKADTNWKKTSGEDVPAVPASKPAGKQ